MCFRLRLLLPHDFSPYFFFSRKIVGYFQFIFLFLSHSDKLKSLAPKTMDILLRIFAFMLRSQHTHTAGAGDTPISVRMIVCVLSKMPAACNQMKMLENNIPNEVCLKFQFHHVCCSKREGPLQVIYIYITYIYRERGGSKRSRDHVCRNVLLARQKSLFFSPFHPCPRPKNTECFLVIYRIA